MTIDDTLTKIPDEKIHFSTNSIYRAIREIELPPSLAIIVAANSMKGLNVLDFWTLPLEIKYRKEPRNPKRIINPGVIREVVWAHVTGYHADSSKTFQDRRELKKQAIRDAVTDIADTVLPFILGGISEIVDTSLDDLMKDVLLYAPPRREVRDYARKKAELKFSYPYNKQHQAMERFHDEVNLYVLNELESLAIQGYFYDGKTLEEIGNSEEFYRSTPGEAVRHRMNNGLRKLTLEPNKDIIRRYLCVAALRFAGTDSLDLPFDQEERVNVYLDIARLERYLRKKHIINDEKGLPQVIARFNANPRDPSYRAITTLPDSRLATTSFVQ